MRKAAPETAVLVLTMFDDDNTVFAGAAGYLLKGADGADIIAAVRAAAAGQAVFGAPWHDASETGSAYHPPYARLRSPT